MDGVAEDIPIYREDTVMEIDTFNIACSFRI